MSIRMGYGLQLALALVGGACLDLPNHECTHDPRHDTHDGRPTPSSGPPPFTGTTDRCYIAPKSLFEQKGIP